MALDLGTLSGDSLEEFSGWVSSAVSSTSRNVDDFVRLLVAELDVDFSVVGEPDSLNYLQWDYDTEIATLARARPGYITVDGEIEGAIDRISGLAVPEAPTLNLPTSSMPSLDAERPSITLPDTPDSTLPDAPTGAPDVQEFAAPDAPDLDLPSVPTFEELQIPVAPTYQLPSFAATAPINQLVAPTAQFSFVDAGYTSTLRDPLVAKLLADLENGGYGIETADELGLWGRARDRAAQMARIALDEADVRAANMNFPMPTGAYFAAMDRARTDAMAKLAEANRDIALKRADMYVENRKFTISQVQEFERTSIALYNAIQERALNVARASVELGIAAFDATVRNFNAQMEAYRVEAQVFESRIRAEIAKAELFRTQVDAERLRGEFNQQRVALYQARLNGLQTLANLYKTRVEAVDLLTRVQGQKIDIFRTRVQAHAEVVRAKVAEFDMFRAAVEGQTAKLDIYKTDVAAYETKLRAEELRVRTQVQANEALTQQYKARVAQYEAQLSGAMKAVEARTDRDRNFVGAQAVNVQVFKALSDAILAGVDSRRETQRMNNDWNKAALQSRTDVLKMRLEQLVRTISHRADIEKEGAKIYGTMLSALITTVNGVSVKTAS